MPILVTWVSHMGCPNGPWAVSVGRGAQEKGPDHRWAHAPPGPPPCRQPDSNGRSMYVCMVM